VLDEILGAVISSILETGVPSPATLRRQRQARLLAATFALVLAFVTSAWVPDRTAALFMNLGCALIAAWVLLFSLVDIVKEPSADTKTSLAAIGVAVSVVVVAGSWLLR
jgi:hypothetical protein